MRRELFPLVVCFWGAVLLGIAVTAGSWPAESSIGAAMATIAAAILACAVTSEYLNS